MQVCGVVATTTAAVLVLVGYFSSIFSVRLATLPIAYYGRGLRSFGQDWLAKFVTWRRASGDADFCNRGRIISKATC